MNYTPNRTAASYYNTTSHKQNEQTNTRFNAVQINTTAYENDARTKVNKDKEGKPRSTSSSDKRTNNPAKSASNTTKNSSDKTRYNTFDKTPKQVKDKDELNKKKQTMSCFHCGERGHWRDDCEIYLKGQPQLVAGVKAYTRFITKRQLYNYNTDKGGTAVIQPKPINNKTQPITISDHGLGANISSPSDSDEGEAHLTPPKWTTPAPPSTSPTPPTIAHANALTFTSVNSMDIRQLLVEEQSLAQLITVPVRIHNTTTHAMIDQGCTNSLIRKSYVDQYLPQVKQHELGKGSTVVSSSGHHISMPTCITVKLHIQNTTIKNVVLFVVDDEQEYDICSDIILGKSFLSQIDALMKVKHNHILFTIKNTSIKLLPERT